MQKKIAKANIFLAFVLGLCHKKSRPDGPEGPPGPQHKAIVMTTFSIEGVDHQFDSAKFFAGNVETLVERATRHIINNECDAAAIAKVINDRFVALGGDKAKGEEAKTIRAQARTEIKRMAELDDPDYVARKAAYKVETQAEKIKALYESELGVSTRGPRLSPLETMIQTLAKRELITFLRGKDAEVVTSNGSKVFRKLWSGKADPKAETIIFGDRTFESLLEGYANKHEEDLNKRAQAKLDQEARDAAKAAAKIAATELNF